MDILAEIELTLNHPRGAVGRMQDLEYEKGFGVIPWGATEPIRFSKDDWHDGVLSFDEGRKEIRIVAIYAKRQRRGAFRALLSAIFSVGYEPVVIEPMGEIMPALLRRWGWSCTLVESDNEVVEEWRRG